MLRGALPAALLLSLLALAARPAAAAIPALSTCKQQAKGTPWASEVIADPKQTCQYTLANWNTGGMCKVACGIYAWAKAQADKPGNGGPVNWPYAVLQGEGHRLVIPTTPCRGVEDWYKVDRSQKGTYCGGEVLFDHAFNVLKSGTDKGRYGMGLNPSARRTRHQLHIHLAPLYTAFNDLLKKLAASGQADGTWRGVKCDSVKKKCPTCQADCTSTLCMNNKCVLDDSAKVKVMIVTAGELPSSAAPFNKVYTTGVPNAASQTTSIVVASPAKGHIAVIKAPDRLSECFLDAKDSSCY